MRTKLWAAWAVVVLGCGSSSGGGDQADTITASAKDGGNGKVSGVVTRSVAISKMGDGVGTLHVGLNDVCLPMQGTAAKTIVQAKMADVDLTSDDASVPFALDGLPNGTYYAAAWFDDVVNKDQDEDLPGKGDLAMFTKATPVCEKVVIEGGKAVDGIKLVLNYEMPFDLTGTMGDEGVLAGSDGGVDPSTIDTSDPNTYSVKFKLTRSVAPAQGGDGKGIAVMALSSVCFEASGSPPPPLYSIETKDVDLSADGATQTLEFKSVKNGIYQLNGYLDDVGEHTKERPLPSTGDMVRFGGFGPGCVEVVVNGSDVEAAYDLNFVMTWDLNG